MKAKSLVFRGVLSLGLAATSALAAQAQQQAPAMTDPSVVPTYDISLFSHKFHAERAGFKCADCHNSLFQQANGTAKAKGDFNMSSFEKGKYCGACHDGVTAFAVTDQGSCAKCHGSSMKPPKTDDKKEAGHSGSS
ncbi:c(7)-type cytochrome triheme domain-containing protein [Candidatus Electronema sp. PJ]|uniref:c(7)-type cytochrome triheme domain-containing protein n=1 Tax=Candidatus Electronema sp. PJ TaxID=3401572 RepID=UPI003AA91927